jgi:hypothetical protein
VFLLNKSLKLVLMPGNAELHFRSINANYVSLHRNSNRINKNATPHLIFFRVLHLSSNS